MLDSLQKIVIERPVDMIILQIRKLITSGELKLGDKLPSDQTLAAHFGVSRGIVREAIRKLDFYGILNIAPQRGTYVAGTGLSTHKRTISDVLKLESSDFSSLVETRFILEIEIAEMAAIRRTSEDIDSLQCALDNYKRKIAEGGPAVEEDLLFHLKIAEASKNATLKSLMLVITPDIVQNFIERKVCDNHNRDATIQEHQEIINYIVSQDASGARAAMRRHLSDVIDFSNSEIEC